MITDARVTRLALTAAAKIVGEGNAAELEEPFMCERRGREGGGGAARLRGPAAGQRQITGLFQLSAWCSYAAELSITGFRLLHSQ
jgi:hypothetical protein